MSMHYIEDQDEEGRIVLRLADGASSPAIRVFTDLVVVLRQSKVRTPVSITGKLGHDVASTHAPGSNASVFVRALFTRWYTQAVQAQAAVVEQLIVCPPYESESCE